MRLTVPLYLLVVLSGLAYQYKRYIFKRFNRFHYFKSIFARLYRSHIQHKTFRKLVLLAYSRFFFRSISVFKRLVTPLIYHCNFLFGNTQISDDIAFRLFANSNDMLGVLGSVKKFFIVNFSIEIRIPLGVAHKNKVVNSYYRRQMLSNTFGNFSRKPVIDIYG